MSITHGVQPREMDTAYQVTQAMPTAIVVIGSAPVTMAQDPSAVVNKPVLTTSAADAMAQLGYAPDDMGTGRYDMCQMMYTMANLRQVNPVVFINVLDPAKHRKSFEPQQVLVDALIGHMRKTGVILDTLQVTAGETALTRGEDYTAEYDTDGTVLLTLIPDKAGASAGSLSVSGFELDPGAVTANDIVGGVDENGNETGAECLRQVFPDFGVIPSIVIAPGWSHIPEVGIALAAKVAVLNAVFSSFTFLDLNTETARTYTDVKKVKDASGFSSPYSAPCWPQARIGTKKIAMSCVAAATAAAVDSDNSDIPYQSPSNQPVGITGLCLEDGTEVVLDLDKANAVNEAGVFTCMNFQGWRTWGNYTAAYPGTTEVRDRWICTRRMTSWWANMFVLRNFNRVDAPYSRRAIDAIIDNEDYLIKAYTAQNVMAGGRTEYLEADNSLDGMLKGIAQFRQHLAFWTPMQLINVDLYFDTDTLQAALLGGD